MGVICIYKTPITRDNRKKKNGYSYMVVVLRAILILIFIYCSFATKNKMEVFFCLNAIQSVLVIMLHKTWYIWW